MSFFIIVRGPLGCGKTTIAEKLAKSLKAEYIAIDRILDENNLEKDIESGYISQKSFIRVNEIVASKARQILESKKPVVFDGNFYWKSQIEDLVKRLGFPHHIFTLKAPLDICIERDKKRLKTHGEDAVRAVYKKSTEFDCGIPIDVTKPLDKCVDEILSHLKH